MRVGIVGCGHISSRHLRVLRTLPGVETVGVCDPDESRARDLAGRFDVPGVSASLSEMIARARPEVVHVLTPPATHRGIVVDALEHGCHVLVEKPMAISVEDVEAMIRAENASGRKICVSHNALFQHGVRRALELVSSGVLGDLVSVDILWRIARQGPGAEPPWVRDLPGGIFQEVAPHPVYLARGLLGSCRVASVIARPGGDGSRPRELRAVLESDTAHASVIVSSGTEPYRSELRIHGTKGTVLLDLTTDTLVRLRGRGKARAARAVTNLDHARQLAIGTLGNAMSVLLGRKRFGHEYLLERFYSALRSGGPVPVSSEDGRDLVALLDQVWSRLEP